MTEPRIHYRIPPCAAYDIPAMESWLEDMAAKGLHLDQDGFFLGIATFEEGPPRRERFRMESTATNGGIFSEEYDPEEEQVQMLKSMGWTYRARRGQFHIYSSNDPDDPELNTAPQVQAMTMAALTKYMRKAFRSSLLMIAVYLLLYFGDMLVSGAIWLGTWRVLLLASLILWRLGIELRAIVTLSCWKRRLRSGETMPHRSDYRRHGIRYLTLGTLRRSLIVLLVLTVLNHSIPLLAKEPYVELDAQNLPLPCATLQDHYPDGYIDRQQGILESQIYTWSDPLAPENHDFTEYAQITQAGRSFDCYLTVTYHQTRWEWAARALTREMASQAGDNLLDRSFSRLFGREPTTVTELSLPGWDYAACYWSGLPDPFLILRSGNVVLRVRYAPLGQAPALEPEELAAAFLLQIP